MIKSHHTSPLMMARSRRGGGGFTLVELLVVVAIIGILVACIASTSHAETPAKLKPWLEPQKWERDTDSPILSGEVKRQF